MEAPKEDHFSKVERNLKNSINLLLSEEGDDKSKNTNNSLQITVKDLEASVQDIQNFFTKSLLTFNYLNPDKKQADEIQQMKEELERKDKLIKEQMKKLSRYRMELEVIQEMQMQARTKTL